MSAICTTRLRLHLSWRCLGASNQSWLHLSLCSTQSQRRSLQLRACQRQPAAGRPAAQLPGPWSLPGQQLWLSSVCCTRRCWPRRLHTCKFERQRRTCQGSLTSRLCVERWRRWSQPHAGQRQPVAGLPATQLARPRSMPAQQHALCLHIVGLSLNEATGAGRRDAPGACLTELQCGAVVCARPDGDQQRFCGMGVSVPLQDLPWTRLCATEETPPAFFR